MDFKKVTISGICGVHGIQTHDFIRNTCNVIPGFVFKAIQLIFDPTFEEIDVDFITNPVNPFVSIECRLFDKKQGKKELILTRILLYPNIVRINKKEVHIAEFYNIFRGYAPICPELDNLHFLDKRKVTVLTQLSPATALKLVMVNANAPNVIELHLDNSVPDVMETSANNIKELSIIKIENQTDLIDKTLSYQENKKKLRFLFNISLNSDKLLLSQQLDDLDFELSKLGTNDHDSNIENIENAKEFEKGLCSNELEKDLYMEAKTDKFPIPIMFDHDVDIPKKMEKNFEGLNQTNECLKEFHKDTMNHIALIESTCADSKLQLRFYLLIRCLKILKEHKSTEDLSKLKRMIDEKIAEKESRQQEIQSMEEKLLEILSLDNKPKEEFTQYKNLNEKMTELTIFIEKYRKKMEESVGKREDLKIELVKKQIKMMNCEKNILKLIYNSKYAIEENYIRGLQTAYEYIFSPENDDQLKKSYLGISFQYLKESPKDEKRLWGVVKHKVLTVLFRDLNALKKAVYAFKDSKFPIKLMSIKDCKKIEVKIPAKIRSSVASGKILLKENEDPDIMKALEIIFKKYYSTRSEYAVNYLKKIKCNFVDETNGIAYLENGIITDSLGSSFGVGTSMIAMLNKIYSYIETNFNEKIKKQDTEKKLQELEESMKAIESELKIKHKELLKVQGQIKLNIPNYYANSVDGLKALVDIANLKKENGWYDYLIKLRDNWDECDKMSMESIMSEIQRLTLINLDEYKIYQMEKLDYDMKMRHAKLTMNVMKNEFKNFKLLLPSAYFLNTSLVRKLHVDHSNILLGNVNNNWAMYDLSMVAKAPGETKAASLRSKMSILRAEKETLLEASSIDESELPFDVLQENYNLQEILEFQQELNQLLTPSHLLNDEGCTDVAKLLQKTVKRVEKSNNQIPNDDEPFELVPPFQRFMLYQIKELMQTYETICCFILSDFMESGKLLFFMEENFDKTEALGTDIDDIDAFNIREFKSMKIQWTPKPSSGPIDCVQIKKIEGIVLSMLLIRDLLNFKVFMIDGSFFQGMDHALLDKLKVIFNICSKFIQIVYVGN